MAEECHVVTAPALGCARCLSVVRARTSTLEAAAKQAAEALEEIVSVAFMECQPDRGDLFSKLDDISRAALQALKEAGI